MVMLFAIIRRLAYIKILVHHPWVKREIKKEIKDFLEFNKNEGTTHPNLWDIMKAMIRVNYLLL